MVSKSSLYVGVMILLLGLLFLAVNIGSTLFPAWEIVTMARLWPLLVIWVGLGFCLPIAIWWEGHHKIAGLVIPGTIVLMNGLVLLYNSLSRDWTSWAYLWTLEPLAIALGLFFLYLLGPRSQGLLIAALVVGGASLAVFAVFVSIFGGVLGGVVGAILLVLLGIFLVARAMISRGSTLRA